MKLKNTGKTSLNEGNYSFNCSLITEHDKDSFIKAKRDIEGKVGIVDISSKQLLVFLCDYFIKHNKNA